MNSVFRIYEYPVDYAAFTGRDLTPGNFIEIYPTTSVKETEKLSAIQVYPNPFTNKIILINATENKNYELFNACGKTIWTGIQIEQHDFSGLASGFYYLKVCGKGLSQTVKTLKK